MGILLMRSVHSASVKRRDSVAAVLSPPNNTGRRERPAVHLTPSSLKEETQRKEVPGRSVQPLHRVANRLSNSFT